MNTLIFDFDGTIADSLELAITIFYEVTGHQQLDKSEIERLRKLSAIKVAREAKIAPHQIPRMLIKGRALMRQRMDEVQVFPDLQTTLQKLHAGNHQLFVMSSNSQQNVEDFLREQNLMSCFDAIYGGVGLFSKTRALKKIIRLNGLKPSQCAYIGDEIRDMQAAHKAKVRAVAVAWGYNDTSVLRDTQPFAVAEQPADLLRIFGKASAV